MNQYFYVPLMNGDIQCGGVSLREHLKVVSPDIYHKECEYLAIQELFPESNNSSWKNMQRMSREIDESYQKGKIPKKVVLVLSPEGFKEIGSEKDMDPIPLEVLEPYKIGGDEVVDVFVQNLDYSRWSIDFFQKYEELVTSKGGEERTSIRRKIFQKFPFISRKTRN